MTQTNCENNNMVSVESLSYPDLALIIWSRRRKIDLIFKKKFWQLNTNS